MDNGMLSEGKRGSHVCVEERTLRRHPAHEHSYKPLYVRVPHSFPFLYDELADARRGPLFV